MSSQPQWPAANNLLLNPNEYTYTKCGVAIPVRKVLRRPGALSLIRASSPALICLGVCCCPPNDQTKATLMNTPCARKKREAPLVVLLLIFFSVIMMSYCAFALRHMRPLSRYFFASPNDNAHMCRIILIYVQ
jgi:hypothetical protein